MTLDRENPSELPTLMDEQLRQVVQVLRRRVGDRAKLHPLMAPVNPLIALPRAGRVNRRVRFFGRPDKDVDEMFAASVDQRCDVTLAQDIETSAQQWKTFIHEIVHWGHKVQFAVKPWLDRVLVRGSDVGEMPGLQRANMCVDDF